MRLRALATGTAGLLLAGAGWLSGVAWATTPPWGPDVSSYQHPGGAPINWSAVKTKGASFAIVKATEGTYYTNHYFASDFAAVRKVGMIRGAYEFARPALPLSTAVDQAKYMVSVTGTTRQTGDLPPILDLEVTGGLNPTQLTLWAQAWVDEVRALTGRIPIVYSYPYFWQSSMADTSALTRFPLWIADYNGGGGPTLPLVGGWPSWSLWQYTSSGALPGIQGDVDLSHFDGTHTGLAELAAGTAAPAWAVTTPAAVQSVSAQPQPLAATVSWQPAFDGGTPVTGYQVTAHPGGASVGVGPGVTTATIKGLSATTTYTFTVVAKNAKGWGARSAQSNSMLPVVGTGLALRLAPSPVPYGQSTVASLQLRRADTGAAVADRGVTLFVRPSGSTGWTRFGSTTTDSAGSASFTVRPTGPTDVYASFAGAPGYRPATSGTAAVSVAPSITTTVTPRTLPLGSTVTATGTVGPASLGGSVYLQDNVGGWRTIATATVARDGSYRLTGRPVAPGANTLRVVHPATGSFAAGSSPWRTETVTAPRAAVRGMDHAMYVWTAGAWRNLHGYLVSTPAVAVVQGRYYYFGIGSNDSVYVRTDTAPWTLAAKSGRCLAVTAAVVRTTVWVGCEGTNHALYAATASVPAAGLPVLPWWSALGGRLTSPAAVTVVAGKPVFFATQAAGSKGNVFQRMMSGSWTPVPLTCAGPPAVASSGSTVELACATTSSGGLRLSAGSGTTWMTVANLSGGFQGPPAMVQTSAGPVFFVIGGGQAMYLRALGTPWEQVPAWVAYGVSAG